LDRLDALQVFVAVLDCGSLAGAARRLGRSPAAVTRAVAFLERRLGARLLHRTTRVVKATAAGERFAVACRTILAELEAAAAEAAGEATAPRGLLVVTAPLVFGARILRPLLDSFLDAEPAVRARLLLQDRPVDLVEEGIDVALRIARMPASGLIATRLGEVRRLVCAAPAYLARRPPPATPAELAGHDCILPTGTETGARWSFTPPGRPPEIVRLQPRLAVDSSEAAIASAVEGRGITRILSYQAEREIADGRLVVILRDFEPPPVPVQLVMPESRRAVARVRAFLDFAAPRLRRELARIGRALAAAA
jgi:DNA-binding transcriptional LysR family regulator